MDVDYLVEVNWEDDQVDLAAFYWWCHYPYCNITGDVMSVEALQGRDYSSAPARCSPGTLRALARNDAGTYSPDGPLAGHLGAGHALRLSGGVRDTSQAAKFVAADTRYLVHADSAALSVGDIYWDLVVWAKVAAPGNNQGIVFKGVSFAAATDYEYLLEVNGSRFTFYARNTANTAHQSVTATNFGNVPANTWCMVHVYHDPVANILGIDVNAGVPNTAAAAGGIRDAVADFQVGRLRNGANNYYVDADIGPLAIWKPLTTNLTAAQLTWLYNSGYGRDVTEWAVADTDGAYLLLDVTQNPIATSLWQMDEASGTRVDHRAGQDLTESGGVISSEDGLETKRFYSLWQGELDKLTPSSPADRTKTVTVEGLGSLAQLSRVKKLTLTTAGQPTGTWIEDILTALAAGILLIDFDTGQTTTADFYQEEESALELTRQLEDTEGFGLVYEELSVDAAVSGWRSGTLFRNLLGYADRYRRQLRARSLVSQATFSDAPGAGDIPIRDLVKEDDSGEIFNWVQADVPSQETVGGVSVLWTGKLGALGYLGLYPGKTYKFTATYTPSANGGYVVWTDPLAGTDVTIDTTKGSSVYTIGGIVKRSTEMAFTITNNSMTKFLYVTLIQARGAPHTFTTPMQVVAEDANSIATYGKRKCPLSKTWFDGYEDALNFCDYTVGRYKDPHARLMLTYVASRDVASMTQALQRRIGDRITVEADGPAGLGINEDFYIENIHHAINNGRTLHIVTYELVACSGDGAYLIVDYSALEYAAAHPDDPTSRLEY